MIWINEQTNEINLLPLNSFFAPFSKTWSDRKTGKTCRDHG